MHRTAKWGQSTISPISGNWGNSRLAPFLTSWSAMKPLRTTVIGSYPLPAWLEFAMQHLDRFGPADIAEVQDDAVTVAVHDQLAAGLDVITDGEQTRLDFNLSFYGYIEGIELESAPPRRFGPPAHDQRGKHRVIGRTRAPRAGSAWSRNTSACARLAPARARHAQGQRARALHLERPAAAQRPVPRPLGAHRGAAARSCGTNSRRSSRPAAARSRVDEPSMSCYAYREDPERFVDIFNRTVEPSSGRLPPLHPPLLRQLQGPRGRPPPLRADVPRFPRLQRATRCTSKWPAASSPKSRSSARSPRRKDVAVGIIDVKSYYIETPEDVADRVRLCLRTPPPTGSSSPPTAA